MQIQTILTSAAVFFIAIATSNPAHAEGCQLEGPILNCEKSGSSPSDIMVALGAKQTREELAYPLTRKINFKVNGDLEKYRSNIEKDWRMITRFARQQERNRKRRRISQAEFETFVNDFAEAEKSYAVALNFYRQLHWQGLK